MLRCRSVVVALVVLLAWQPFAEAAGERLDEAQVRVLIDAMEVAAKNQDARTVASYMSDDCVLTTTFPAKDGGKKISSKDKRQYVAEETAAQAKTSGHEYVSTKPTIDITADGRIAKASYKVTDNYMQDDKQVKVVAYQIATVELRKGEPIVTAVDVDAVSMAIDDRQIF